MLSLVSGHYPAGPGQVAVTQGVATTFNLRIGDVWHQGGQVRQVTGIVQNPQSLLDEFALVAPGQVSTPSQVTVLFNAPRGKNPAAIGSVSQYVVTRQDAAASNPLNPETIVLALATVGMLLIALVAVGGFTVLAQRRLRSLGMLGALGATDRNIRLVVRANGVLVGVVGALAGAILGLAVWLAYRPQPGIQRPPRDRHVPAAVDRDRPGDGAGRAWPPTSPPRARPARSPGSPSSPPCPDGPLRRSRCTARRCPASSCSSSPRPCWPTPARARNGGGAPELVFGFVALIVAVILLAPFCLAILARLGRRAPIAARLALRDLARYRARSGSALAAISLGVLIAVLVCVLTAQRYGNVLDYAGPNVASNQIIVYTPNGGPGGRPRRRTATADGPAHPATASTPQAQAAVAQNIAKALGSNTVIELDQAGAISHHAAAGRSWSGPIYVATPQLLQAFGIKASDVNPDADILTMRPGLSGISQMQLVYGDDSQGRRPGTARRTAHQLPVPEGQCVANPVIQEVGALPAGTSAPNTVITEHAIHTLGLQHQPSGWLIQTPHPPTAAQITNARLTAGAAGMTIETKTARPRRRRSSTRPRRSASPWRWASWP